MEHLQNKTAKRYHYSNQLGPLFIMFLFHLNYSPFDSWQGQDIFSSLQRPGREAEHSTPSSA
jgi:hypothetical protein